MFRPYRTIIRPYYKDRFIHSQYILGSQIIYTDGTVVTAPYAIVYSKVETDIIIDFCLFKKLRQLKTPLCLLATFFFGSCIIHILHTGCAKIEM
jgi:hypothetical protein